MEIGHCRTHKTFHSHTKRITYQHRDIEVALTVGGALGSASMIRTTSIFNMDIFSIPGSKNRIN